MTVEQQIVEKLHKLSLKGQQQVLGRAGNRESREQRWVKQAAASQSAGVDPSTWA
jgi:hypothetical protein